MLQKINNDIRQHLKLNQWRSTTDAINWFKSLENKNNLHFIQMDIVNYYPSITEELFLKALEQASNIVHIEQKTKSTITKARQSLLFHQQEAWIKNEGLFDVTMGAYDGAEVCELVGLLILAEINKKTP